MTFTAIGQSAPTYLGKSPNGDGPKHGATVAVTSPRSIDAIETCSLPAPTPRYRQSLLPHELAAHRAKIAFNVEIILQGYWDSQPPAQVKAGILADFADSLDDWTLEQVVFALRKWRNEFPNKKPNPGHIKEVLLDLRGRAEVKRMPVPDRPQDPDRVTAAAATDILALAGFGPKRMDGSQSSCQLPPDGQD